MGHVFARLTGYGLTLVPVWPYSFERSADTPGAVVVTHWADETERTATVTPGTPDPALTGAEHVDQIVDVQDGPAEPVWRIATALYSVEWPVGFDVGCPQESGGPPFDLWGPDGALISPQGPLSRDRIPPLAALAGPGQTVVDTRSGPPCDVVDLSYRHEGADWRQTHHLVPLDGDRVLVISAQSPAAHAATTRRAAETVARSVTAADG